MRPAPGTPHMRPLTWCSHASVVSQPRGRMPSPDAHMCSHSAAMMRADTSRICWKGGNSAPSSSTCEGEGGRERRG
jgi:hypothetical protein